ncbi:MAG: oligopeptide/dipeptide ABC transporter ATP-binding protein [Pseudomonadota bacterium]
MMTSSHVSICDSPIVKTKNLTRYFRLKSHFFDRNTTFLYALNGVDIDIFPNEIFCVVGESGCGKTTLGRLIMGLDTPSQGEVYFGDQRIDLNAQISTRERLKTRKRMQMIFQNPFASLNPRHRIDRILSEPLKILEKTWDKQKIDHHVEEMMEKVGADPKWKNRYAHEFSGGQRQRIAIARALITKPDFVVADEPVSALDVSIQAQILNLLMDLSAHQTLSWLFITHDLSVVYHFGDRVAVMYMGNVVEMGKVKNIFEKAYHPYTQLLISAIPSLSGGSLKSIKEPTQLPDPTHKMMGCAFHLRCPFARNRCREEKPLLKTHSPSSLTACHGVEEGWI